MWIYIILGIVAVSLVYVVVTYHRFIKLSIKVKEAFATMDVYLKKRWNLIPGIVLTITGYIKYERETLEEVIRIRSGVYDMMSSNDKIYTNEQLSMDISKIMMVAEKYPDLKTNQNFLDLSTQLSNVENDIADAGKYYNTAVRIINLKIQMFPSSMVATLFRFKVQRMFEASRYTT
jgi:Uncharacterized conserved protein